MFSLAHPSLPRKSYFHEPENGIVDIQRRGVMQPPTYLPDCLPACLTTHYTAHPTSNSNERISPSNNVTHDETPTSIIQTEEGGKEGRKAG